MIAIERGTFLEYFEKQLGVEAATEGDIVGSLLFSSASFDRKKIIDVIISYFSETKCEIKEDKSTGNDREIYFSITRPDKKILTVMVACGGGSMLVMCS